MDTKKFAVKTLFNKRNSNLMVKVLSWVSVNRLSNPDGDATTRDDTG